MNLSLTKYDAEVTQTVLNYFMVEKHLREHCLRLSFFYANLLDFAHALKDYWLFLEEQRLVPDFFELPGVDWLIIGKTLRSLTL